VQTRTSRSAKPSSPAFTSPQMAAVAPMAPPAAVVFRIYEEVTETCPRTKNELFGCCQSMALELARSERARTGD
jgi:hypothetical protein